MPYPTPTFTPWFPWAYIDGNAPPDTAAKLSKVGCYLLARFDGEPTTGAADPADPAVFYIGETHGNTTSLWGRIEGFGNSAGFYGGQWNGHYAAWRYPNEFPQDVHGTGQDGAGKACNPARVFFALCPWPDGLMANLRGIFPTLIEQQAIWLHTEANGEIPKLNNSGRVQTRPVPPMPAFTDAVLDDALARAARPLAAEAAVKAIAQHLAVGMRYSSSRQAAMARYGRWYGTERRLGREYIFIGWRDAAPHEVTLSVYRKTICEFDGGSASTRDDLRTMLADFWNHWAP